MNDRFEKIDITNDKVKRIINASFEVFVKNDFDKASTNNIVKTAGVSRGLLYHYFKDKQELFDFLLEFSIEESMSNFEHMINWDTSNLFERYKSVMEPRIELIRKYPYILDFSNKYRTNLNSYDIRARFEKQFPGYREKFYHQDIDFANLKEGVDIEKMTNVLRWTLKGMMQEFVDKHTMENFDAEIEALKENSINYIEFLKEQFYK